MLDKFVWIDFAEPDSPDYACHGESPVATILKLCAGRLRGVQAFLLKAMANDNDLLFPMLSLIGIRNIGKQYILAGLHRKIGTDIRQPADMDIPDEYKEEPGWTQAMQDLIKMRLVSYDGECYRLTDHGRSVAAVLISNR